MRLTRLASEHQDFDRSSQTVSAHAAERLARAIVAAIGSPSDPRTLAGWAQSIGTSRGALRCWCSAAHVRPKDACDFARLLRAVVRARDFGWDLQNLLDIVDPRTLRSLLHRARISQIADRSTPPDPQDFIESQHLIADRLAVQAIRRTLGIPEQRYRLCNDRPVRRQLAPVS